MDKQQMSIRESIELCFEKGIKGAQSQLDSFDKNRRLGSKYQIEALKKNLECIYESALIEGSGVKGVVTLGALLDEQLERKDERKENGYRENEHEIRIRQITTEIIRGKYSDLGKFDTGLSYSGWATFLGLVGVDDSDSYEEQLAQHLEISHRIKANEFFKPYEIISSFKSAHSTILKGVIDKALSREDSFNVETFYNVGKTDEEGNTSFHIIHKDQYDSMMEVRKDVLTAHGVEFGEYLSNIKKKNKTERMKKVFADVEDTLARKFNGASRFHKSLKVTIDELEDLPTDAGLDIDPLRMLMNTILLNQNFTEHFVERSITYRNNNRTQYQNSTYFWRRFYYLNTCYILQFNNFGENIDKKLFVSQQKEYLDNLKSYLYDFDVNYYMDKQVQNEGGGFFGEDLKKEIERRHNERIENMEIFNTKEKVEDMDIKVVPFKQKMTKSAQEDLEWLGKFKMKKAEKVEENTRAEVVGKTTPNIPSGAKLIDLDDEELMKEWEAPVYPKPTKVFMSQWERDNPPIPVSISVYKHAEQKPEVKEVEFANKKNYINMAEIIANQPPIKGFGWEIEQRQKELALR